MGICIINPVWIILELLVKFQAHGQIHEVKDKRLRTSSDQNAYSPVSSKEENYI